MYNIYIYISIYIYIYIYVYIYIYIDMVCLTAVGANNVSWPWVSLLQGCGGLTMALTGKFVYMAHHFILAQLNLFDLVVHMEGWWLDHSCVIVAGLSVSRGC